MATAVEIGASLFVPATHKDLLFIAQGVKYPNLKSVVIDTEDGLPQAHIDEALHALKSMLLYIDRPSVKLFVRPKNIQILHKILSLPYSDKLTGFVLPKFDVYATEYIDTVASTQYMFMPSIEDQALFSYEALEDIRQILLPFKARIPIVRFGLEDMLGLLGMQLEKNQTLFDVAVLGRTVSMLIAVFKPYGFEISGGVYRYYEDDAGFMRNIREDMRQGLWGKTLIHPRQIDLVNEACKVDENSLKKAQIFFAHHDHAITAQNGQMLEHATMQRVMRTILERAKHYGVNN